MLKGRSRDPRVVTSPTPARAAAPAQGTRQMHSTTHLTLRTPILPRAPLAKPEPDYEVVEFPSEQYVNAKLQPPPPPPPRPPTGHPAEAASCGLCGGGGARVRCAECGRRALCASCDDMYHRHPKRRHHQRQALSLNQMRDERPPLPPKAAPPVPPPRRHKMGGDRMSSSPRPPSVTEQRATLVHPGHTQTMPLNRTSGAHAQQVPPHLQKLSAAGHVGSMPYLSAHHAAPPQPQLQPKTLGQLTGWDHPRGSLPGFNVPPHMMQQVQQQQMAPERWESPESVSPQWGRPLRRGASVLELGGGAAGAACGCAAGWRYGSCASLDHQAPQAWGWPPACCHPPHPHPHAHAHVPMTPQPYRRVDSRAVFRAASRAGSRAASPAVSVRSRASRRNKHRTPSPPPLPSSDADSESESDDERARHDTSHRYSTVVEQWTAELYPGQHPALDRAPRSSRRNKHRTPSPPPLPSSDADSESESDDKRARHDTSHRYSTVVEQWTAELYPGQHPAPDRAPRPSRRNKHRTPSPPPLPSSDADSESESDDERARHDTSHRYSTVVEQWTAELYPGQHPALDRAPRSSRRNKHRTPSPPPLPSSDADSESESDDKRARHDTSHRYSTVVEQWTAELYPGQHPAPDRAPRPSRRNKHRTPSPPPLPSSDADSESESDDERARQHASHRARSHAAERNRSRAPDNTAERARARGHERDRRGSESDRGRGHAPENDRGRGHAGENDMGRGHAADNDRTRAHRRDVQPESDYEQDEAPKQQDSEDSLGPPPAAASAPWQCEHCTFVNEPGVRVCVVCCRTPTAAPRVLDAGDAASSARRVTESPKSVADNARSVADSARSVAESARGISRLEINDDPPRVVTSPSPVRTVQTRSQQNGQATNKTVIKKERVSTGCGPSPPREENSRTQTNRLVTPTREQSIEPSRPRHDMAVGPSPPRETQHSISVGPSPPRQNVSMGMSPYKEVKQIETPARHSVSVGPSPPRENSIRTSPVQKKSAGTSPPREAVESRSSSTSLRANVSNTGTSPPPQSISTQTYEVANAWEHAPSSSRSRARRRFRDDARRERSHSRHSLSSDTRESERSARTSGGGRWEWRETRDSSPGAEWSGSERRPPARLTRRASHLDLRRDRAPQRRSSFYSQAASPEPPRAMSLEVLAGAAGAAAAERGLELARLMAEAERLGFSAAEVQAALAQSPAAPLAWLRERWPSLCAGVRAAAARLAPLARVSELEARAALARHRGAMWPAVTDCVERHRRQTEQGTSAEGRVRGRVWGSPAGADDDAAPPARDRLRAEDSSDEFDGPPPTKLRDDDWMYLPLDAGRPRDDPADPWAPPVDVPHDDVPADVASDLRRLLVQARIPAITDDLLLSGLLSNNMTMKSAGDAGRIASKPHLLDFIQSENDFIEAYNALARSSPLPSVDDRKDTSNGAQISAEINSKRDTYDVIENDSRANVERVTNLDDRNNIRINNSSHELVPTTDVKNQSPESHESNKSFESISLNTVQNVTTTHSSSPVKQNVPTREEKITNLTLNPERNSASDVREDLERNSTTRAEPVSSNPPVTLAVNNATTENRENVSSSIPLVITQNNTNKVTPPIQKENVQRNDEEIEPNIQPQEKTNNLNDIVDNTQRLIQQMKDEINSDINSIDSRNISQSEADSSSNESDISTEHESSYSDTEDKETDELSTNESETADEESEEEPNLHDRRPTIIHRTSSEENDEFEEAMDHIEDQIEDFKNTNIEILDSIARSLQEEHTISLDNNEPIITHENKEDLNNNLFVEVNSFEEIYAELNSNVKGKADEIRPNHIQNKSNGILPDQSKAAVSNVQANDKVKRQISPSNDNSIVMAPKNSILDLRVTSNVHITKENVAMSTFKAPPPIMLIISETNQIALNAIIEDAEENAEFNNDIQENSVLEITEAPTLENNVIITEITVMSTIDRSSDEDGSKDSTDSDATPTDQNDSIDNFERASDSNINTPPNFSNEIAEKVTTITVDVSHESQDNNMQTNHEIIANKKKSPEKSLVKPPSESKLNKTFNAIKSNIPKLVKVVQNKQKGDKSSPKVIASKVPVRRGSIKQHPAPEPPKSHFGNIQNGHVKQLQTRLFNNKFPKTVVAAPSAVEPKPSTSTMHKKKQAPPPPTQNAKGPECSPPKEKKSNFFRESCRTEDEWTESDAEDAPPAPRAGDEPSRAPSPPPPVTLRRVSGQIIDLAKVRLPEGSPERQARMLLAEGATETWEQARLAVELVSRGAEAAAALLAALECADLPAALAYLHQDCELCAERLPEHEMVSMLRCTHRCCRSCARIYFTVQVTERSIADCVCPYCKLPDLESLPEDAWLEYFAHLDIQLKALLEPDVHELFQRKLRDRTLARDPNFRWCMECSSGFFVHPKQKKIRCPECRSVSCAKCRKPWSINHEGLSCEQYAAWLEDNDPERSIAAVQQHLRENGLECPRCHFKYSLSRGGCMHFTCTQCKYEFCYGCGKPFMMGARCGLSEYCAKLGLHAHHPRNCLFYLRDKEPHELQTLLQMNNVPYETEAPEGSTNRCPIQLQRETPTGLVDGTCGSEAPPNYAGLCKNHYLEYLSRVVRARGLDTLPLLDVEDLETLVRRAALRPPPRPYGSLDGLYRRALLEIVKEKIPLD